MSIGDVELQFLGISRHPLHCLILQYFAMSSTIGDYLFWKLSTIGVRRVLSRGQSEFLVHLHCIRLTIFIGQLFLGSIHRNHLNSVNITHNAIASYSTEIAAFVVSSTSEDLAACYEVGQHNFPQRPAIFIQELDSAETRRYIKYPTKLSLA